MSQDCFPQHFSVNFDIMIAFQPKNTSGEISNTESSNTKMGNLLQDASNEEITTLAIEESKSEQDLPNILYIFYCTPF